MSAVPDFRGIAGAVARVDAAGAARAAPIERDRIAAVRRARELLAALLRDRDAIAYPVHALGPLADAARAIALVGQMQPALAGQSVLAAAALLTQGLANVQTLAGVKPLSLYLLTLGLSGDGKSTADALALRPLHQWQREQGAMFDADRLRHRADLRALKKGDPEPEPPRSPYRLVRDPTVEGLRRDLEEGPSSQAVINDEAGAVLAGHGMTAEHRAKTAATYNGLWDRGHVSVSRAGGGRIELHDRRVSVHWMLQPSVAGETLADAMLSASGFWPRFLLAWPASCEPRKLRVFAPDDEPAIAAYWHRCADLLALPLPTEADAAPTLKMDAAARELAGAAFERAEVEARRGRLRAVRPFALRAAEQAARVAGVLAAFDDRAVIGVDDMRGALEIVGHSVATWRAMHDEGVGDPAGAAALRLYEWLTDPRHCPEWEAPATRILNGGPSCVRTREKRDAALDVLAAAGLVHRGADNTVTALTPPAANDDPAERSA